MEFFYDNNRDGTWDDNRAGTVQMLKDNFVPVILDSYLPGTPSEKAFVDGLKRGGTNTMMAAAASGKSLGHVGLPGDLKKMLDEYRKLPESERKALPPEETAAGDPNQRPPTLPEGGFSLMVYQTPIVRQQGGAFARAPNLVAPGPTWHLKVPITMNDLVWGTAQERQGLFPQSAQKGHKFAFPESLVRRLFSTQAYDWFLGYQNDVLPLRAGELTAVVEDVSAKEIRLRLEGFSKVGGTPEDFKSCKCEDVRKCGHWGSDVNWTGVMRIDRAKHALAELRLVGLGESWTRKDRGAGTLKTGAEVNRYPVGLVVELPSDCMANKGGWPPLAPERMRGWLDYWSVGKPDAKPAATK